MKTPLISIIMSVYNEPIEWVKESIESIINQTYNNFEFIIIIDNPELEIDVYLYLVSLSKRDSRIIIVKNENNYGLAKSLNIGIDHSKGSYIARMDADDISDPQRLEKELNYLIEHDLDVVSCLRINIDENSQVIDKITPNHRSPEITLKESNCICHPGVLMTSKSVKSVGGYRAFYKSQDYDLWLRLLSNHYKFGIINEYLLEYRINPSGISSSNKLEQFYISEYQKRLFRERKKNGCDSFSPDNLQSFLSEKRITPKRNKKYCIARKKTDLAIRRFREKNILFVFDLLYAFIMFPLIPYNSIKTVFKYIISR